MGAGVPFDYQITFVYTKDLEASARFYEEVLDLTLVQVQEGGCRIYRSAGGAYLGVCRERAGRTAGGSGVILCFVVEDVEDWHDRLVAAGVEIEVPPTYSERFGVFHIFFRDPNGYLLEIQRFDDKDWHVPLANADV